MIGEVFSPKMRFEEERSTEEVWKVLIFEDMSF